MPQYKSKEVCPSKYLTMTPASELSHTDCTGLLYPHLTDVILLLFFNDGLSYSSSSCK